MSQIVQFIIALPQIWKMIQDILKMVNNVQNEKRKEAIDESKKAKTEEEIKNAVRNRARNP